jgi:DNA polymerase-3 subunit epsilon
VKYELPPPAEWQQLQAAGDLRLLRRVPPVERWELPEHGNSVIRAAVVDCETTGLGDDDEVVELAIVPFAYDKETGRVVRNFLHAPLCMVREPSKPIPAASTAIHGITQEMVAGHSIAQADVEEALDGISLVIAHNARFDRPMVERHWSAFASIAWACSCDEIDWRGMGFSSRSLEHVLLRQGWFFDGHRALDDAMATLFLLTLDLPTGEPALSALLANARKPSYYVGVYGTPIDENQALKARGYDWNKPAKTWWTTVSDPIAEKAWLETAVSWPSGSKCTVTRVSPVDRYSDRVKP